MNELRQAIEARKRQKLQGGDADESTAPTTAAAAEEQDDSSSSSSSSSRSDEEEEEEEELASASTTTTTEVDLTGTTELVVLQWLERTMQAWLADVVANTSTSMTASQRQTVAIANECHQQLQPLLALLRTRTLDDAKLLAQLAAIVGFCTQREYRQAHDQYLQITIGNAAWPIGVTMVGIHARSGREKIAEDKVKHLMKNETSRQYMMSVKRLMTRHQEVFPPSAPSKRMS